MSGFIGSVFSFIFGTHSIIATVIISMLPIIELKGAIPIGMSVDYWGEFALNGTQAFLFSLLGSCLVVPIIALIFTPLLKWLKQTKAFRRLGVFIDEKVKKHSKDINDKVEADGEQSKKIKSVIIKCILIFFFVAVPLPLTGVWTGTCVAVAIGLKYWQTILSVVLGNIVAGLIITVVCAVFPEITTILSIVFICIVLVLIALVIYKIIRLRKSDDNVVKNEEKND